MVLFGAWQAVVPIHIHLMEENSSNILLNYYFCDGGRGFIDWIEPKIGFVESTII